MSFRYWVMETVRTYIEKEKHKRVQRYALDNSMGLQEAYCYLLDVVLNENGELRGNLSALTPDQTKAISTLAQLTKKGFDETMRTLIDISLVLFLQDVPFRDVIIEGMPHFLERAREGQPELVDRIMKEFMEEK